MARLTTIEEVFDAIQRVKLNAPAFCTNFFPVQRKLEGWIEHGELFGDTRDGAALFLRKDRDLWHLFFSAADIASLSHGLKQMASSKRETTVTDLVGDEKTIGTMRAACESASFRPYARLLRLSRLKQQEPANRNDCRPCIQIAAHSDADKIMTLLEASFDRRADQLPSEYEIEAAIAARQVLVILDQGNLAAMLHFETQGLTSTVRYWAVAEPYRSRGWGSALMKHYLSLHPGVKRFLLWVNSQNRSAIQKYEQFGYSSDGLVDHVLLRAE